MDCGSRARALPGAEQAREQASAAVGVQRRRAVAKAHTGHRKRKYPLIPVVVPGIFVGANAFLICRPLPLAQVAVSATGGAPIAPPLLCLFFGDFLAGARKLPRREGTHISSTALGKSNRTICQLDCVQAPISTDDGDENNYTLKKDTPCGVSFLLCKLRPWQQQ